MRRPGALGHAGDRSRRRQGDAAAPAYRAGAEAGADPGRPALPRLHDRVAGGTRGDRGRARLRLPAGRPARGAGRRGGAGGGADPLRGRARAARHRRRDPLRRRPARRRARRALPGAERRRAHRPRPDGAAARARAVGGGDDDRPAPGRGLLGLRPGQQRRGGRGARVPREDRRAQARRGQRRDVRADAAGPEPDPAGRERLDRARRFPAPGRQPPARAAARRLLDGHRHPRALPAGELGHPRGPGGDPGRALGPRRPGRPARLRWTTQRRSAHAPWSEPAAGSRRAPW